MRSLLALFAAVFMILAGAASPVSATAVSVTYTYDALGRMLTATYTNGVTLAYTYDAAGNRTQVATSPPLTITTASLPAPQLNQQYGPTVVAAGGTPPYAFSASGLPSGISLAAGTGVFSGIPTAAGNFTIVVTVTDAHGATASASYPVTIVAPPVVSPTNIPTPVYTKAYTPVTISATGGAGTLTLAASGLPAGMSFTPSTGVLAGTPSAAGAYSITITATDANNLQGSATYSGTIAAAPVVSPTSIPTPVYGRAYTSAAVSATGGTGTLTLSATGLPSGLSFNASTGVISGTTTATGAVTVTVTATDANGLTGSGAYSWNIIPPPTITTSSLATPVINQAYSQTLSATGGTTPYTFSVTSGALPPGLTISTAGVISGTPSTGGAYNFTVTVTDVNGLAGSYAYASTVTYLNGTVVYQTSTDGSFSFTVSSADLAYVSAVTTGGDGGINTDGGSGGTGGVATSYFPVSPGEVISGFIGNFGGFVSSGIAPSGGASTTTDTTRGISQTGNGGAGSHVLPGAGGTASGGNVSNVTGTTGGASGSNGSVVITTYSAVPNGPAITTTIFATPVITRAYSQTISASGGTPTYTFSVSSGTLPTGLSISSSGVISGTPSQAGTYSFTVLVVDANHFTSSASYSATVGGLPSISTASLPTPAITKAYSQTISATGGTPAYTFSLYSGALPTGLSLGSSGVLSGTPSAAGAYSFTVMVTDANGLTTTAAYSWTINPAPSIATTSLPTPVINQAYSQALSGANGTTPYSFAVTSGALPPGLTISTAGIVSGTPSTADTYAFTITLTDANGLTANQAYSVTVHYLNGAVMLQNSTLGSFLFTVPSAALGYVTVVTTGGDGGINTDGGSGGTGGVATSHFPVSPGEVISGFIGNFGGFVSSGIAPSGGASTTTDTTRGISQTGNGGAGSHVLPGAGGTASGGNVSNVTGTTGGASGSNGSVTITASST